MCKVILVLFALCASVMANDVLKDGHKAGAWTHDLDAAKEYAAGSKKFILLNFTGSDWCGWCKLMDKEVFSDPEWKTFATKNLAQVWIDRPKDKNLVPEKYVTRNIKLMEQYGVKGFPSYLVLSPDGSQVLGKLGAGRGKTAASFSQEVVQLISAYKPAAPVKVIVGVKSTDAAKVNESLLSFSKASLEEKAKQAKKVFEEVKGLLSKDPVYLSVLNSEVLVGLIPYGNYAMLQEMKTILDSAAKAGTPADSVIAELDKVAPAAKGDLELTYKYMAFYSMLGMNEKAMKLMPDMAELKKVESLTKAQPWINLLRTVSKRKYLELCFALQKKEIPLTDRLSMVNLISKDFSEADDEFTQAWFEDVLASKEMLAALKTHIKNEISVASKKSNFKERTVLLSSMIKVINMLSGIKVDTELSRLSLRYWQSEYANSLVNYRNSTRGSNVRDPRTGRMTRKTVAKSIKFAELSKSLPSDKTISGVSDEEIKLFDFQKAVAKVKQGIYDKEALSTLISFKDEYPKTVAQYCGQVFGDWADKVDPNNNLQRASDYYYVNGTYYYRSGGYGRAQQQSGIPLTRSRQVNNLKQCSALFKQIYDSGIEVDPQEQLQAFTACFSYAEIITEDEIRLVFPDLSQMTDEMMVQLASHVASLIQSNWRDQKAQQQLQQRYRTNRNEDQVKQEIVKAYKGIISIMRERLESSPDNISLIINSASYLFDLAEFQYANELCTLEEYTELRDESFTRFRDLAVQYEKLLEKGDIEQYTAAPFINWFSIILGASELNTLDVAVMVSNTHLDEVKKTLFSMNEKWREEHVELFGQWVSGKWSRLKPHVKLSFLQSAKEVMGDHSSITKIEEQMALYQDILSEVKLNIDIDGPTDIGHNSEFGALVSLRHTPEIEREAGGFNKYLKDAVRSAGINTPVDYRKNFTKNIKKALKEKFEINGMTWIDGSAKSKQTDIAGWRETPMVYLKLKALDPSVDQLPSMQIDMDFNDGHGSVVLPVLSNVVLVNAQSSKPVIRPYNNAEVELLLDSRGAADGKVSLEVKVTGEGILPDISKMLKTDGSYELTGLDEATPIILRLEQKDNAIVPVSELTADLKIDWDGKLQKFTFPELQGPEDIKVVLKKYKDADIVPADKVTYISTVTKRGASFYVLWSLIALIAVVAVALSLRKSDQEDVEEVAGQFKVPSKISVVSVLKFLNQIQQSNHPAAGDDNLQNDIKTLEKSYFAKDSSGSSNLESILKTWNSKVNG